MARNMHIRNALIEDLRALPEEVIDRAVNHFFITGNRCRRENDSDTCLNMYRAVILVSDTRQRGGWFTLAACTDDDDLLRLKFIHILDTYEHTLRNIQVAKFNRHLHVIDHAAAD